MSELQTGECHLPPRRRRQPGGGGGGEGGGGEGVRQPAASPSLIAAAPVAIVRVGGEAVVQSPG